MLLHETRTDTFTKDTNGDLPFPIMIARLLAQRSRLVAYKLAPWLTITRACRASDVRLEVLGRPIVVKYHYQ